MPGDPLTGHLDNSTSGDLQDIGGRLETRDSRSLIAALCRIAPAQRHGSLPAGAFLSGGW